MHSFIHLHSEFTVFLSHPLFLHHQSAQKEGCGQTISQSLSSFKVPFLPLHPFAPALFYMLLPY